MAQTLCDNVDAMIRIAEQPEEGPVCPICQSPEYTNVSGMGVTQYKCNKCGEIYNPWTKDMEDVKTT